MRLDHTTVWDEFTHQFVAAPEEMNLFLDEIIEVCRKHGFSISHEDSEGGFKVVLLDECNLRWLSAASKSYTKEVDPVTGKMYRPAYLGSECPSYDISCGSCRYLTYCFPEWSRRSREKLEEILRREMENSL